jgi:hypothetical protein
MIPLTSEHLGVLSNFWWATVANDYSVSIFLIVSLFVTVLKIVAIINPSVKSNDIICLLQTWTYGIPGIKKQEDKDKPPEQIK